MAANVYASATEGGSGSDGKPWTTGAVTLDCPDVGSELTTVPDDARTEVDKELALLDQQIAAAYRQLQDNAQAVRQDDSFADNAVMNPLTEKRSATIERIAVAVDRTGDRPQGLDDLAECTLRTDESQNGDNGQNGDDGQGGQDGKGDQNGGDQQNGNGGQAGNGGQDGKDEQNGNGGQAGNGPVPADYVDITTVQPTQQPADPASGPSRGTFATSCGVNKDGLFNSDNVIVAPGVSNGAHHFHDYVGNQSNTAFASDEDLAKAQTSCVDQGDKSTYYWPVLRLQNGTQERDANSPGGGIEGNAGQIVTPKDVTLTFVGNARSKVTEMPRLLRIITGDAKAFVNGPANANASWSCTGFEDRQLKDKYPLCPSGSDVVRTFHFQSCWDGRNIDSANHRTHVAFAAPDGGCPEGFRAIPQLVQRIVYDVDAPSLDDGGRTTPLFAVDSFPEQLHKPVTDHGDFINVFDEGLMRQMVGCINEGRQCGAGQGGGGADNGNGGDTGNNGGDTGNNGGNGGDTGNNGGNGGGAGDGAGAGDNGAGGGAGTGDDGTGNDNGGGADNGSGGGAEEQPPATATAEAPQDEPTDSAPQAGNGGGAATPGDQPRVYAKPTIAATSSPAPKDAGGKGGPNDQAAGGNAAAADSVSTPAPIAQDTSTGTEPQASQGGLAETGAQLWPAAAGAVLVLAGVVLLFRRGRRSF
ncbi:DUF1996 domain-containing protein [Streptomyces longwoodensis]